ncbi:MAG: hypothetical protein QQN63_13870, partial [Nitrosopumilus sp.]
MTRLEILNQVRLMMLTTTASVTDAEIILLIDTCMDEISTISFWPFLQKNATITAVADQQTYAVPNDFMYAVALIDDDNDNIQDMYDFEPLNPFSCTDSDLDFCDDC